MPKSCSVIHRVSKTFLQNVPGFYRARMIKISKNLQSSRTPRIQHLTSLHLSLLKSKNWHLWVKLAQSAFWHTLKSKKVTLRLNWEKLLNNQHTLHLQLLTIRETIRRKVSQIRPYSSQLVSLDLSKKFILLASVRPSRINKLSCQSSQTLKRFNPRNKLKTLQWRRLNRLSRRRRRNKHSHNLQCKR